MILNMDERREKAQELMRAFAERTGIGTENDRRRYLWTDAFAVCNLIALSEHTGKSVYLESARELVDAVHRELGSFRDDDSRSGRLSGLGGTDAKHYPTVGGLRIGKALAERSQAEPYDEQKEWDRDGQYFHYLTKWMHALDTMARATGEVKYNRWAVELAKTAHRAFTYTASDGTRRMYWKMSTDLSRPLVSSMGQHDALDAYVTYLELSVTASSFGDDAGLAQEMEEAAQMAEAMPLRTDDPLGLGGLLFDAVRVTQLIASAQLPLRGLLRAVLEAAYPGVQMYVRGDALRYRAQDRLAFRELGLSTGLHGISLMETLNASVLNNDVFAEQLDALRAFAPIAETIELFWLRSEHRETKLWKEHEDINDVMLATSLLPDGFLKIMREKNDATAL